MIESWRVRIWPHQNLNCRGFLAFVTFTFVLINYVFLVFFDKLEMRIENCLVIELNFERKKVVFRLESSECLKNQFWSRKLVDFGVWSFLDVTLCVHFLAFFGRSIKNKNGENWLWCEIAFFIETAKSSLLLTLPFYSFVFWRQWWWRPTKEHRYQCTTTWRYPLGHRAVWQFCFLWELMLVCKHQRCWKLGKLHCFQIQQNHFCSESWK